MQAAVSAFQNATASSAVPMRPAAPTRPARRAGAAIVTITSDILSVWDCLAVFSSGLICAWFISALALEPMMRGPFFETGAGRATVLCALLAPTVLRQGTHGNVVFCNRRLVLRALGFRMLFLAGIVLAVGFLTRLFGVVPRSFTVMFFLACWATTAFGRMLLLQRIHGLQARGMLRERVAVVGHGAHAERFQHYVANALADRIEIVGFFSDDGAPGTRPMDDLLEMGKRHGLDWAVIADPAMLETKLETLLIQLKALDVAVAMTPPLLGSTATRANALAPGNMPLVVLAKRPFGHQRGLLLKTLEDKILGGLLLLLVAPVMLTVAIAIKLDSPGPVFFRQRRHGHNNTEFDVLKFRSMSWSGAGSTDKVMQQTKRGGDSRVTRVGKFLRTSSLDELPQLINVLRSEMSLVGPRPHPVVMRTEDQLGSEITQEYAHRHRVKPGITGWAQINGSRGATETAEQVRQRVHYDNEYIEEWSLLLDLKILLLTPLRLLNDPNAF